MGGGDDAKAGGSDDAQAGGDYAQAGGDNAEAGGDNAEAGGSDDAEAGGDDAEAGRATRAQTGCAEDHPTVRSEGACSGGEAASAARLKNLAGRKFGVFTPLILSMCSPPRGRVRGPRKQCH